MSEKYIEGKLKKNKSVSQEDFELAKWFAIGEAVRLKKGVNVILNPPQAKKFKRVVDYFEKISKAYSYGKVKVDLVPHDLCGFATCEISFLELRFEDLKEFLDVMSLVDVVGIDALTNGRIEIGINVNDVYMEV